MTSEPSTESELSGLVATWERAVAWVRDRPNTVDYDDFVNLLDQRDSLAAGLAGAGHASAPYERRVAALDASFKQATQPISASIDRRPRPDAEWWRWRIPTQVGDEFRLTVSGLFPEVARELPNQ